MHNPSIDSGASSSESLLRGVMGLKECPIDLREVNVEAPRTLYVPWTHYPFHTDKAADRILTFIESRPDVTEVVVAIESSVSREEDKRRAEALLDVAMKTPGPLPRSGELAEVLHIYTTEFEIPSDVKSRVDELRDRTGRDISVKFRFIDLSSEEDIESWKDKYKVMNSRYKEFRELFDSKSENIKLEQFLTKADEYMSSMAEVIGGYRNQLMSNQVSSVEETLGENSALLVLTGSTHVPVGLRGLEKGESAMHFIGLPKEFLAELPAATVQQGYVAHWEALPALRAEGVSLSEREVLEGAFSVAFLFALKEQSLALSHSLDAPFANDPIVGQYLLRTLVTMMDTEKMVEVLTTWEALSEEIAPGEAFLTALQEVMGSSYRWERVDGSKLVFPELGRYIFDHYLSTRGRGLE